MKSFTRLITQSKYQVLLALVILAVLLINTLHFSYPDEMDSILGGHYIVRGILPYIGFFTHHGPGAYFYAAILEIFTGTSFVRFRFALAVSYWALLMGFILYFRNKFDLLVNRVNWVFILLVAVGGTYFWGQMLLADTLSGYLLIFPVAILFWSVFTKRQFQTRDILLISISTAVMTLTSLTYIYVAAFIYLLTIFWFLKNKTGSLFSKPVGFFVLWLLLPYLLFAGYLVITRSVNDYYYQSIYFNQKFYVTSGDSRPLQNPLRYTITIFVGFFEKFRAILLLAKDLNFSNPFPAALALGDVGLIIYLLFSRQFVLAIFVFLLLPYLNIRSDLLANQDTNYQGMPYDLFSFYSGVTFIFLTWQSLAEKIADNKKLILGSLLVLVTSYYFFLSLFLFGLGLDKAYKKYMGTQSLIYDRPAVSGIVNQLVGKNDYYYIGPFAYEELLYVKNGKLASKYNITIPAMQQSEKIKSELLADLKRNKPKIMIYSIDGLVFGTHPAPYLYDFLKQEFFTIDDLNYDKNGTHYNLSQTRLGEYDVARHFFFDRNRKDEIVSQLEQIGLITRVAESSTSKK